MVLDPPCGGAPEQTAHIAASGAGRVVYVSYNPAALARDAKLLKQGGYRVVSVTLIDQFVRSARLESVAVSAR